MLLEIPLTNNYPSQTVSTFINNQYLTFNFFTIYSNDNTEYLMCNIYLGSDLIAAGVRCVHAAYLNQYITNFNGYLFFYSDDQLDPTYERLGTVCKLLYTDFDALQIDYNNFVQNNLAELQARIGT